MKDSGVEWIGKIPEDWEVLRLKYGVDIDAESLTENFDKKIMIKYIEITSVDSTGLTSEPEEMLFGDAPTRARRIVHEGDTIISTVRPNLQAIAFFDKIPKNLIASTGFATLSPKSGFVPKFVYYYSFSHIFFNYAISRSVGVGYPAVGKKELATIPLLKPREQEQFSIVSFLDSKTLKINQIIDSKIKQIELLREHEKALIHQAVTKGLNPKAKMKNSGIEWIGEIPVHYRISRLKKIAEYLNGLPFKPEEWGEEGYPIIRIQNLTDQEKPFNYFNGEFNKEYLINDGDLLISWSASIGIFRWNRGPAILNQHIFKVTTNSNVDNHYFFYLISAALDEMISKTHGSTMTHITDKHFRNFYIPLPPLTEQKDIAIFLGSETSKIHEAIKNIESQISKLEEYRKSLIYEVVTGKVKMS
jgi:restriction endonuclease S subunit